jgi:hypothetical protein
MKRTCLISCKNADLKADKEVAVRDVKALMSDEQVAAMDVAWAGQHEERQIFIHK